MTELDAPFKVIRPRVAAADARSASRRDLPARRRRYVAIVMALLVAACEGDGAPPGPSEFLVRFMVTNALIAPVTISIDGTPHVRLSGGRSIGLAVPSTAQWLTWTSAKPLDARGRPIPDDIGDVTVAVSGIDRVLEIRNVIDDQTYITARVFNLTTAPVSIGVYDGSAVSCAAELPAATSVGSGFVLIGYYRLRPATEVRAYRDPSRCTGPYVAWPRSQLAGFSAKSGLLTLVLEESP